MSNLNFDLINNIENKTILIENSNEKMNLIINQLLNDISSANTDYKKLFIFDFIEQFIEILLDYNLHIKNDCNELQSYENSLFDLLKEKKYVSENK